VLPLQWFIFSR